MEADLAADQLRTLLQFAYDEDHPPIAHYHAEMSSSYKTRTFEDFLNGTTGILCATEAAGMVSASLLLLC